MQLLLFTGVIKDCGYFNGHDGGGGYHSIEMGDMRETGSSLKYGRDKHCLHTMT